MTFCSILVKIVSKEFVIMLKSISNEKVQEIMDYFNKTKHEDSFEFTLGSITDFIISTPHSVLQTREGKEKLAEPYTGVIAKLLNSYYGYSILCKTKNCDDDANYDEKSSYKEFLYNYCKKYKPILVIDLHGLSKKRECTINLGTNYGQTLFDDTELLGDIIQSFRNIGISKITTDHPFDSSGKTIAGWISSKTKQKAIQIEINSGYFDMTSANIVKIVNALHHLCQKLRSKNVVRSRKIDIENLRLQDNKFYESQSLNDFEYVNGIPEIVISAPHAKKGMFAGKVKQSESMTGSICKTFYKEFGFSIIYKSKDNDEDYFNSKTNAYKSTLFKEVLSPKTRLFLELHVLSKSRVQDVTIFLPKSYENEKLYQIINILNNHNLHYFSINSVFDSYKKSRTINQIRRDCFKLQLCFNERLIEDNERLKDIVDSLKDIISLFI